MTHPSPRIPVPILPVSPEKQPFPLVATLAPVVMSVVIWLVTQSTFALLFAALGPAVAIASVADARRSGRRRLRLEHERFDRELHLVRAEISAAHDRERDERDAASPSAAQLAEAGGVRWGEGGAVLLRVGCGDAESDVTLEGASLRSRDAAAEAVRELRTSAAVLRAAPISVAAPVVGIAGSLLARRSLQRSLVVQLAARLSPLEYTVACDETEPWMSHLPHRRHAGAADGIEFRAREGDHSYVVVTAEHSSALPRGCACITLTGARAQLTGQSFGADYLSHALATSWAMRATAVAERDGLVPRDALLPNSVQFAELELAVAAGENERDSLEVVIGVGEGGAASLDLVGDGPHAVIGGITGSGKSELLVTWLLAMATRFSPRQVNFLLFDFKGGASFGDVASLPHAVGLVTDLDQAGAARALSSLTAELRYRERLLSQARVRDITDLDAQSYPARLVVVVDEFAAMAADFPDLHAAFADLAARGRSLGVHLVLCTQRPAGVVRDAVLANTGLRISLRVNNRADSVAVIGTDAAAELAGTPPGRAMVSRAGASPVLIHVAIAGEADLGFARTESDFSPRRPWLDPLPTALPLADLPVQSGGIAFGLIDLPAEQSQPTAVWSPPSDGTLLIVGATGSGKTSALRALGRAQWVPADVEGAWDALVRRGDGDSNTTSLTIIDDLDQLLARCDEDYQRPLLELVARLARSRAPLALSMQRLTPALHQLAALCDSRLLLRMPSRQEHLLAGGSASSFDPDLPPGGASWRGVRAQVALAPVDEPATVAHPTSVPFVPLGPVLAVAPRPAALVARLAAQHIDAVELGPPGACDPLALADGSRVLVADADLWQAHWSALGTLRSRYPMLFVGSSLAEFRALSRSRVLPPPITNPATTSWLLDVDGVITRVGL